MSSDYTITIASIVNNTYTPNTTLTPVLQATGNASIEITGYHLGDGTYRFSNVDDGNWHLFSAHGGTKIEKWGGTSGRWIGDDNLEVYAKETEMVNMGTMTGNLNSAVVSLQSATASLNLAVASKATISANQTFTGINNFSKRTSLSGGTAVNEGNWFRNRNDFMDQAPYSNYLPINNSQLANKYYVDSEITTRIVTTAGGAYQESPNIVRIIPSGSATGSVFTSFQTAMAYCIGQTPTNTKQYTILITGEGTSSDGIEFASYTSPLTAYTRNYVHWKGLGADIKVLLNGTITTNEFKATTLGNIIIEDLYFYSEDGGDSGTQVFENIIFKNCKFYSTSTLISTFTGCKFEGVNDFSSYQNNAYQFVNCTGSPISTDAHSIVVSGTNKINFRTPSKMTLGVVEISDNGGNFQTSSPAGIISGGGLVTNGVVTLNSIDNNPALTNELSDFRPNIYFGTDATFVMTKPSAWVNITINGIAYALPLYEIA